MLGIYHPVFNKNIYLWPFVPVINLKSCDIPNASVIPSAMSTVANFTLTTQNRLKTYATNHKNVTITRQRM